MTDYLPSWPNQTAPQTAVPVQPSDPSSPDYVCHSVRNQYPELAVVRAIQAGFPTCTYLLIQRLNESFDTFAQRRQIPLMFDAVTPNIRDLVGRILKDDPQFQKVSTQLHDLTENIDNRGTGFTPFLDTLFEDACWAGHAFVLVDHTTTTGAANLADELNQGARPYWVWFKKDQVISYRPVVVDGVVRLGQVVIAETVDVSDGTFGSKTVPQWRVLKRTPEGATWELWQKNQKGQPIQVSAPQPFLGAGGVVFADIPLVPFYARRTGFLESRPLAIELARLVQADYNVVSDMEHNHWMSSYPVLVTKGLGPDDLNKMLKGGSVGIALPTKDDDAAYIAGPGNGVDLGMRLSEKFRREMVVQGNRLFETDQPDRETATAKGLDDAIDINVALRLANSFQDSLDLAFDLTEKYLSGKDEGGEVILAPNIKQPDLGKTDPNAPPTPPPNQTIQRLPTETALFGR